MSTLASQEPGLPSGKIVGLDGVAQDVLFPICVSFACRGYFQQDPLESSSLLSWWALREGRTDNVYVQPGYMTIIDDACEIPEVPSL